jgi:hypothetical protein
MAKPSPFTFPKLLRSTWRSSGWAKGRSGGWRWFGRIANMNIGEAFVVQTTCGFAWYVKRRRRDRPPREYIRLGIIGQQACWLAAQATEETGLDSGRHWIMTAESCRWKSGGLGCDLTVCRNYVASIQGYPRRATARTLGMSYKTTVIPVIHIFPNVSSRCELMIHMSDCCDGAVWRGKRHLCRRDSAERNVRVPPSAKPQIGSDSMWW